MQFWRFFWVFCARPELSAFFFLLNFEVFYNSLDFLILPSPLLKRLRGLAAAHQGIPSLSPGLALKMQLGLFFRAESMDTNGGGSPKVDRSCVSCSRRSVILLLRFCTKYSWWRLLTYRLSFHRDFAFPTEPPFMLLASSFPSASSSYRFFNLQSNLHYFADPSTLIMPPPKNHFPGYLRDVLRLSNPCDSLICCFRVSCWIMKSSEPESELHVLQFFYPFFTPSWNSQLCLNASTQPYHPAHAFWATLRSALTLCEAADRQRAVALRVFPGPRAPTHGPTAER